MRRDATTDRARKPLKLNVTQQALEYLVEVKQREGHRRLSETLEYLLDLDRGRFADDRGEPSSFASRVADFL
jgi:hypothetical protein